MLFNSLDYLIFLPLTVIIFHNLPEKYRSYFLLAASYIFYSRLNALSPLVLILTTITGYFFAIIIYSSNEKLKQKLLLTSIIINIVILICFREIFKDIIPAIGVSFFTFQNISYLIDCCLEKIKPEKNFLTYSLYISFFPKLLQGPIERGADLIPQFKTIPRCNYETMREGALLFIWGMFKKVLIADNLAAAIYSMKVNINNNLSNPIELLLITYFYSIQIYCDFSGYTSMALGSAKLFGINLTDNFNYPYFSVSVQEFWRRWHITLSNWILDYIFKPLQMTWRNYGNYGITASLLITFLACGIWHGLSLKYLIWGLYHGILISISFITYKKWMKFCKRFNQKFIYFLNLFITFHLVSLSWWFFMPIDLTENFKTILLTLFSFSFTDINIIKYIPYIIMILIFIIIEILKSNFDMKTFFYRQNAIIRWLVYYILIMTTILLGKYGPVENTQFIYFQF